MSKRAEEKAIAYADKKLQVVDPELWETSYTRYRKMSVSVMSGIDVEEAYQDGYEQAEKDLALTWEDVAIIITIYEAGIDNGDYRRYNDAEWMKEYSQDILRRFNEQRP